MRYSAMGTELTSDTATLLTGESRASVELVYGPLLAVFVSIRAYSLGTWLR